MLVTVPATAAEPVTSLLELRRQNVTIQEWDLSCGAAALASVLRYQFGDMVSEQEIATAMISRPEYLKRPELVRIRQGFSLWDLKLYVDRRGYEGVGLGSLTIENLEQRAPILVPISTNGYNHFVVFRGRAANRVLLADPAWGNRTMTLEQFERAWIRFPKLGRVGFVIESKDANVEYPNRLGPDLMDFLTFN
ncbi:MAG: peptidase C39 [Sphingobacteriia bacterium]|nr:peptidase C39 [Sphingobacteriia bacterium]NCC40542.1 peptidase C39 [Gammaproteobacteria bacterium]